MKLLTSPFKAYVRWRHSHGFGVHSPFAYDLIKMAIRPGSYEFYGYQDIDNVVYGAGYKGYPKSRHDARLLLRLLVQLATKRLILPDGLPAMSAAASAAGVEVITFCSVAELPSPEPGDMMVTVTGILAPDEIIRRLRCGSVIFAMMPGPEEVDAIYEACNSHGLIFHGVRLLLAVPREEMAFVAYTMKF